MIDTELGIVHFPKLGGLTMVVEGEPIHGWSVNVDFTVQAI